MKMDMPNPLLLPATSPVILAACGWKADTPIPPMSNKMRRTRKFGDKPIKPMKMAAIAGPGTRKSFLPHLSPREPNSTWHKEPDVVMAKINRLIIVLDRLKESSKKGSSAGRKFAYRSVTP
jgi:hypothetical protein